MKNARTPQGGFFDSHCTAVSQRRLDRLAVVTGRVVPGHPMTLPNKESGKCWPHRLCHCQGMPAMLMSAADNISPVEHYKNTGCQYNR